MMRVEFLLFALFFYSWPETEAASFRVTNGTVAQPGQFPFMAIILVDVSYAWTRLCSGTILDKSTVITTASCLATRTLPRVRLGATSFSSWPRQDINVKTVLFHPDYQKRLFGGVHLNDIAVLKLERPMEYTKRVDRIELCCDKDAEYAEQVTFTGYGRDEFRKGKSGRAGILRYGSHVVNECSLHLLTTQIFCTKTKTRNALVYPNVEDGGGATIRRSDKGKCLAGIVNGMSHYNEFYHIEMNHFCPWIKSLYCRTSLAAKDTVFVLDSSGSIENDNFTMMLQFVDKFVSSLIIGPENSRVALLTFSNSPEKRFGLSDYTSQYSLSHAVKRIPRISVGGTNTRAALKFAYEEILKKETRPGAFRYIILLTDGQSSDNPVAYATTVKNDGVRLITIGIGSFINREELIQLASPNSFLSADNFQHLTKIYQNALKKTC